jgi:hypothetical protein
MFRIIFGFQQYVPMPCLVGGIGSQSPIIGLLLSFVASLRCRLQSILLRTLDCGGVTRTVETNT